MDLGSSATQSVQAVGLLRTRCASIASFCIFVFSVPKYFFISRVDFVVQRRFGLTLGSLFYFFVLEGLSEIHEHQF